MARQSHNGDVTDNLNLYHDVCAALWAALDTKAAEEYQEMADEVNARAMEPPVSVRFISASFMSVIDRYLLSPLRNQSLIDQATTLLERIIGFGPGQLGKVAWIAHCMYEDADGKFCGVK